MPDMDDSALEHGDKTTLIAEARVETAQPSRYLVHLCRHFNQEAEAMPHPDVQAHIEWSETDGVADFGFGRCTMQTDHGALMLRAEAPEDESLERVETLVAEHLERFGSRDELTVSWTPARRAGG
jgi:hypothetical protein